MASKQYARSMDGLLDACFDQLQDLRDGVSNPAETMAFARTAEVAVSAVDAQSRKLALEFAHVQRVLELENRKMELANEQNRLLSPARTEEVSEVSEFGDDDEDDAFIPVRNGFAGEVGYEETGDRKPTLELSVQRHAESDVS